MGRGWGAGRRERGAGERERERESNSQSQKTPRPLGFLTARSLPDCRWRQGLSRGTAKCRLTARLGTAVAGTPMIPVSPSPQGATLHVMSEHRCRTLIAFDEQLGADVSPFDWFVAGLSVAWQLFCIR